MIRFNIKNILSTRKELENLFKFSLFTDLLQNLFSLIDKNCVLEIHVMKFDTKFTLKTN